jgi:aminopeptidase N
MGRLFAPTIYQKGGWVVAMLRYVVGDEAFFAGLKSYLETNAFGNGTSQGLKAAMEASSGIELDAFFDEWVYGLGYPTYATSWSSRSVGAGRYQVDLRVVQTQRGTGVFTIPLEIEVGYADGTTTRERIAIPSADHVVSLCLDASPTRVTVDPDNRVLGTVSTSGTSVAAQPAVCGDDPDPVSIEITGVSLVRAKGKRQLEVTGVGFVVGDSRIEVDGTALAKTKYPAGGGTTRLIGQNARLTKEIIPKGATVQVTVVNGSTGERSAPFAYTRTP